MKLKYEKPYIELIKCENNQLILSSKWPRYTFWKNGQKDIYIENPSEEYFQEKKNNGWHCWDNDLHKKVFSKKNNLWE